MRNGWEIGYKKTWVWEMGYIVWWVRDDIIKSIADREDLDRAMCERLYKYGYVWEMKI